MSSSNEISLKSRSKTKIVTNIWKPVKLKIEF